MGNKKTNYPYVIHKEKIKTLMVIFYFKGGKLEWLRLNLKEIKHMLISEL